MEEEKMPETLLELLQLADDRGMSDEEKTSAFNLFLNAQTRKKAIPLFGQFELTPLCNLSCRMCYVHLAPEQMNGHGLLPVNIWKNLIDKAVEAGMMKASLTGGECLTYPGFDEIYLHLWAMGIRTAVLTNGVLLTEERVRFFQRYPPSLLQISLYGSGEEEYEAVCGVRCFKTVLTNIKRAHEAKLPLFIAITPNRFLPDRGESLLRLVASLDIPYNINSCLFTPRAGTGREDECVDMETEDYIHLYKLRAHLNGTILSPIDPRALPDLAAYSDEFVTGLRCGAGMNAFTIQWDGAMIPCSSLSHVRQYPLKTGFEESWKNIHEAALRFPVPAECETCKYNSVCPVCVAIHAQDAPLGHASPRRCSRARRLVESGLVRLIALGNNNFPIETKKEEPT